MNYVQAIETAQKAKSPIVAIPLPGEIPFAIRRNLLTQSLKGLRIIDAGLQLALSGKRDESRLVVYAAGDNVKAVRHFAPMRFYETKREINDWADAERQKRSKGAKPRTTAREKQIAKLKAKLAKMGKPEGPRSPWRDEYNEAESIREHDAKEYAACERLRAEGIAILNHTSIPEQWHQWKQQASTRRWVQLQARLCKAGKLTTAQLYATIAKRGLTVRKWSELRTHDRDRVRDLYGYLDALWEFCGLRSKPYNFRPDTDARYGAERFTYWLSKLHEYKELEAMIAGVETI